MTLSHEKQQEIFGNLIDRGQIFLWQWQVGNDQVSVSGSIADFLLKGTAESDKAVHKRLEDQFLEQMLLWADEHFDEASMTMAVAPHELKLSGYDEKDYWLKIHTTVIVDHGQTVTALAGIAENITELKRRNARAYRHQAFLTSLLEIIPYPVFYKNKDGIYEFCNNRFSDYLKLPKEKIIGKTVFDVSPPELAQVYFRADQDLIRNGDYQEYVSQVVNSEGERRDVSFEKTVYKDRSGRSVGLMGIIRDITGKKQEERRHEKQESIREFFLKISQIIAQHVEEHHLFDILIEGLVDIFDDAAYGSILEIREGKTLHMISSHGYLQQGRLFFEMPLEESYIFSLSGGELEGCKVLRDLTASKDRYPDRIPTWDGGSVGSVLYIPVTLNPDKKLVVCLDANKTDGFDEADLSVAEFIKVQMPILYQVFRLNQKTVEMSRYDGLTGLVKREYFQMLFEDRKAMAKRTQTQLILVMMDLDGLKRINDRFGHHAGDMYIKTFAEHVSDYFRDTDIISRIGGDEFAGVFLTERIEPVLEKFEAFRELFKGLPIEVDSNCFFGSFCFGYAVCPRDGTELNALMKQADISMYEQKKRRRQP